MMDEAKRVDWIAMTFGSIQLFQLVTATFNNFAKQTSNKLLHSLVDVIGIGMIGI